MSQKYSRKELLQALRELSEKLGRTPKKKDLRKNDASPSPTPYYREFGSLTDAVRAAGLDPNEDGERRKKYSQKELLQYIRDLAEDLERTPTKAEMKNKDSFPSPDTYYDRFGSWTNAVEEAGLESCNYGSKYSHEELTDEIQHVVEKLGRVPTQQDMREYGEISPDTYHDRFGSWTAALEELGYEPVGSSKISVQQLKEELHRLTGELGCTPTRNEMRNHGKYGSDAYRRAFGSWNNALRECGFEPVQAKNPDNKELLQYIRDLAEELGHTPSKKDLIKDETCPSPTPYYTQFGSWKNAIEQAGLEPKKKGSTPTPRQELIEEIQRLKRDLGRSPNKKDLYKDDVSPSPMPYYREFGSWSNALEAAGLEPNAGPTEIEQILYNILDELNIQYETEVRVVGNFPVDAILADQDIVIEADGMRWHGHPDRRPYDEIQRTQIKRDRRRDETFAAEGYHVVRFWESTLKNSQHKVTETMLRIVKGEEIPEHGKHVFGPEPCTEVERRRDDHELTDFIE